MAEARFLTFHANERLYALPAEQVVEIIRLPDIARVPQAPKGLLGLANLRGSIVPVASLRGLLGGSETDGLATRAIILEGLAPVALSVDAVDALVNVDVGKIETRQTELAAKPGERLKGAFATDGKNAVAKILDIGALIDAAFLQDARMRPRRALNDGILQDKVEDGAGSGSSHRRQMLVTFEVAGQEYAFPLEAIHEVVDAPETLAVLPSSEDLVLGVAPFRDTLLPLLSLRGLLGFTTRVERSGREKVVVARIGGTLVGLVADRMRTIFPADADLIERIPPVIAARAGGEGRIAAIYRGDGGRRLISILSPGQLFREDVMQRLKTSGGAAPAANNAAVKPRSEERQFLVFRLGGDEFGLPIEAVSEVARVPDQITRVPRTPEFLEGVVNLRGEVLPVVDQRRRFDMPALEQLEGRRLIVIRTERHRAGLIVDSVSEVLRCSADEIEPSPNLTNEAIRLVHGVINLATVGRIVLLLDPAELLTRAERSLLDAFEATTERARA